MPLNKNGSKYDGWKCDCCNATIVHADLDCFVERGWTILGNLVPVQVRCRACSGPRLQQSAYVDGREQWADVDVGSIPGDPKRIVNVSGGVMAFRLTARTNNGRSFSRAIYVSPDAWLEIASESLSTTHTVSLPPWK